MRVHENFLKNGGLAPGVFRDQGSGMSTDWEKYSTPTQTRARAKEPTKNGVIQMQAGSVREIPALKIEHSPKTKNRAHTDVLGEKTTEARVKLRRISQWVITI